MKLYFPLSDLCPHCNKKLEFYREGEYIKLYCRVNKDVNFVNKTVGFVNKTVGFGWEEINFYALLINNKIVRIDYRINHFRITNDILYKKTYITTKNDYGRKPPLATNLTWFAPLDQPEIIEDKLNTFLLLI